jgi:hypothetical protein
MQKALPCAWPGFYLVLGDAALKERDWLQSVRVYWNVTAQGALRLTRSITEILNREGFSFRFKVLSDLSCFRRCDSSVLYLKAADFRQALPHLATIHDDIEGDLLPRVPALTLELAPGVAIAESPSGGDSFGLNRCGLLAAGIVNAQNARTSSRRLAIVADHFASAGIDLTRPYAAAGSTVFDDLGSLRRHRRSRGSLRRTSRVHTDRGDFLDASQRIASSLITSALWDGDRCTWVAADRSLDPLLPPEKSTDFSPIGGDLQSGSGGIALFLAELGAKTGERHVLRTALGAARHALSYAARESTGSGGLYSGGLSAALAAAYTSVRLGDEAMAGSVRRLLPKFWPLASHPLDLLSGVSGASVVLIALADLLGDPTLLEPAVLAADVVLASAHRDEHGLSWPPSAASRSSNLLGFTRGASGIGYALLEMFVATGHAPYRSAALDAFSFERAWFDRERRNWPVLPPAQARSTSARRIARLPAHTYWCHGAPGAAMARLRGYEVLALRELEDETRLALETTSADVESIGDVRLEDFSLCHGLTGHASVLHEGSRALPGADPAWLDTVERIAYAGLEVEASCGGWLCGSAGHGAPGLLVGAAGVGMFYLQMHDRNTSSALLIRPRDFAGQARR